MIPRWIERRIEWWRAGRKTGIVRLHFMAGKVSRVYYEESELAPAALCEACQDGMEIKDGGALLVCPSCGEKRFPKANA